MAINSRSLLEVATPRQLPRSSSPARLVLCLSSMSTSTRTTEDDKRKSLTLPPLVFTKPVPPHRDAVFTSSPDIQLELSSLTPLPSAAVHWSHSSNDIRKLRLYCRLPLKKYWRSYEHNYHDTDELKGEYCYRSPKNISFTSLTSLG